MALDYDIKSEVSDTIYNYSVQSDDENLDTSTLYRSHKRYTPDEQDSSMDSFNAPGSPLPPRKRAKTQEEKEQRRVERIMRNRQAAHASREKKRRHLETLEAKCLQLESENIQLRNSLSSHNSLKARLTQLESALKLAQSSGDISSLDSALAAVSVPADDSQIIAPSYSVSGSPAPSLEDDCASPDALVIKSEEDEYFLPHSPAGKPSVEADMDDMLAPQNFSLEVNPASTASIEELLDYADTRAYMGGPDATYLMTTVPGTIGEMSLFDETFDTFHATGLDF